MLTTPHRQPNWLNVCSQTHLHRTNVSFDPYFMTDFEHFVSNPGHQVRKWWISFLFCIFCSLPSSPLPSSVVTRKAQCRKNIWFKTSQFFSRCCCCCFFVCFLLRNMTSWHKIFHSFYILLHTTFFVWSIQTKIRH